MRLTTIWQVRAPEERDWVEEVFGSSLGDQVFDGQHSLVIDNALVIDSYLHSRDPQYFARFAGKNAFLLHLSDETFEGNYEIYQSFRGVFRNYWSNVFSKDHVLTLPLGYENGLRGRGQTPKASARPLVWSFVGAADKSSRPDMLLALDAVQPFLTRITDATKRTHRWLHEVGPPLVKADYRTVLHRSVFVPCPMGNVNLESFRVYEALEAGCIPIVERRRGFDYFRNLLGTHPLPAVRSWAEAQGLLLTMMRSPKQLDELQTTCVEWWLQTKRTLGEQVREFIARRGGSSPPLPVSSASWCAGIPFWQSFELSRHHSPHALARRMWRQGFRKLTGHRTRITYGC